MKKLIYLMAITLCFSCGEKKSENKDETATQIEKEAVTETTAEETTEEEEELPIIVGKHQRKDLEAEPYGDAWFKENFELHPLDEISAASITPLLKDVEVTLFMGTWCSDSQMQVPAFFKIMDKAGFDENKLTLITMTEDKTTPENLEEGLDITNVPTIIFSKDGKELNRIVEAPIETLEKDMLKILLEEDYKHLYME